MREGPRADGAGAPASSLNVVPLNVVPLPARSARAQPLPRISATRGESDRPPPADPAPAQISDPPAIPQAPSARAGRDLYDAIHSEAVADEPALRKLLVSLYDARLATWTSLDDEDGSSPERR